MLVEKGFTDSLTRQKEKREIALFNRFQPLPQNSHGGFSNAKCTLLWSVVYNVILNGLTGQPSWPRVPNKMPKK